MATKGNNFTQFEHSVWYSLYLWPALSLAVKENWGGPDASGKRDWFAGAIVELFEDDDQTDAYDVESRLLQIMLDEFEVAVDDDTAKDVAEAIVRLWGECSSGNLVGAEALKARYDEKVKKGGDGAALSGFHKIESKEGDQETDGEESGDEDADGDVHMDEAPQLVRAPKEKVIPEVDEDGFTTVVKKKR